MTRPTVADIPRLVRRIFARPIIVHCAFCHRPRVNLNDRLEPGTIACIRSATAKRHPTMSCWYVDGDDIRCETWTVPA